MEQFRSWASQMEVVVIGIVQMVFQMSLVGWIRHRVSRSRKPPSRLRSRILAPASCGSTSSIVGMRYRSRFNASLGGLGSMQSRIRPSGFVMTSSADTHDDASVTGAIMPFASIFCSFAATLSRMPIGSRRRGRTVGPAERSGPSPSERRHRVGQRTGQGIRRLCRSP